MIRKFVTAAQADAMVRRARGLPLLSCWVDKRGVLGYATTEYYVVPDDDPRLQSPGEISDTDLHTMN